MCLGQYPVPLDEYQCPPSPQKIPESNRHLRCLSSPLPPATCHVQRPKAPGSPAVNSRAPRVASLLEAWPGAPGLVQGDPQDGSGHQAEPNELQVIGASAGSGAEMLSFISWRFILPLFTAMSVDLAFRLCKPYLPAHVGRGMGDVGWVLQNKIIQ